MSGIRMEDKGTLWRREIFGFLVRYRTTDQGCGDFRYLVTINEPQPMFRLDGDPVEKVKLWDLQHVLDCAELSIGRTQYRCANWQGFI